jgi:hypothetical protein
VQVACAPDAQDQKVVQQPKSGQVQVPTGVRGSEV